MEPLDLQGELPPKRQQLIPYRLLGYDVLEGSCLPWWQRWRVWCMLWVDSNTSICLNVAGQLWETQVGCLTLGLEGDWVAFGMWWWVFLLERVFSLYVFSLHFSFKKHIIRKQISFSLFLILAIYEKYEAEIYSLLLIFPLFLFTNRKSSPTKFKAHCSF